MSLLLISKGCYRGGQYLAHIPNEIFKELIWKGYDPKLHEVVYVPYAEENWDESAEKAGNFFRKMGFSFVSIHSTDYKETTSHDPGILCVGEGNAFRLLKTLQEKNLLSTVRELARRKRSFIGIGSSGCAIVNKTIELTCDTPIAGVSDLNALGIYDHVVIPNFRSGSLAYNGKSIEKVAQEHFNKTLEDVLGLSEGNYLLQGYGWIHVGGTGDAVWFNSIKNGTAVWRAGETKWTAFSL